MKEKRHVLAACAAALCVFGGGVLTPSQADAFCGFYAGGAGAALYNNATQVVLMRDGTKTILSMQNNFQGPLEDFAMVIPVPVVLMEENVKTLDKALFDKVDQLSAPRLVEYWEQDPCQDDYYYDQFAGGGVPESATDDGNEQSGNGVTVEAEFKVGEYEIAILSANDSMGLETWLTSNNYNIPAGAEPVLRPYVEGGMYFFVARIIAEEVTYEDGRAVLSPLRFHYDSETFTLPIRLGLISAENEQDLLVYILGQGQRYEAANYPNVTIPTNVNVREAVLNDFGAFYNELFARTLEANPGAVVTEYAWDASTCDPCPGPTLDGNDLATLGADILSGDTNPRGWTLTRLHARYTAENVGEDLVFAAAEPIAGGREFLQEDGELEEGAVPYNVNNFQGRYAIRYAWEGAITCDDPQFGRWGGPPGTDPWDFDPSSGAATSPNTSGDDYQAQSAPLEALVDEEIPEIGLVPTEDNAANLPGAGNDSSSDESGCSTMTTNESLPIGMMVLLTLGAFKLVLRRRQ